MANPASIFHRHSSLGSFVAHQLAMAGVGDICLVDPEELKAANVGRHRLGMRQVGCRKAKALAGELQADFPHLSIRGFVMDWQQFRGDYPDEWDRGTPASAPCVRKVCRRS